MLVFNSLRGRQDGKHHPVLIELLSKELGVTKENILDFELCLADFVPAVSAHLYLATSEYSVHIMINIIIMQ